MKSPEAVLRTALVGTTAVTALVGSRIYPLMAPASASLPFVTWRRVGIQRRQTLGSPLGLPRVTLEYTCYGTTYESARDVADEIRKVLDGYGGQSENTVVEQVSLENESDDFVSLAGADLPPVYAVNMTFDVWWQET